MAEARGVSMVTSFRSRLFIKLGSGAIAAVIMGCVALIDYATKYETAVSLLYLVPVVSAAWFSWRIMAVIITILSGMSDTVVAYLFTGHYSPTNALNSGIQTVFFVAFALALAALKRSRDRLEKLSREDPLTKLVNSRHFFELGTAEIQRAARYQHPLSIAYIDVDDFKAVNDALGHSAGNTFLREIARTARGTMRRTDVMARLGGDEFGVLLPETGAGAAQAAVERMRDSLLRMDILKDRPVTFSVGVVTTEGQLCEFDELIRTADSLMYEAKRAGKNTVRYGTCGAPRHPAVKTL